MKGVLVLYQLPSPNCQLLITEPVNAASKLKFIDVLSLCTFLIRSFVDIFFLPLRLWRWTKLFKRLGVEHKRMLSIPGIIILWNQLITTCQVITYKELKNAILIDPGHSCDLRLEKSKTPISLCTVFEDTFWWNVNPI